MDGQSLNNYVGFAIALVGLVSWAGVLYLAPHRYVVTAPVMVLLAAGLMMVSTLTIHSETWWVGVFAAANRAVVAGAGIRALRRVMQDARVARHDS